MKKFKDLVKDDIVYFISIDPVSRSTNFKTMRVSISVPDRHYLSNLMIFFKDSVQDVISVPQNCSFFKDDIPLYGKPVMKFYFTEPDAIDEFLKDEIERQRKFMNHLESLSKLAWTTVGEKLNLIPGKIYYYKAFSGAPCLIGKDGDGLDWDGFRVPSKNMTSENIREATTKETTDFYERLTRLIKSRTYKESLIESLERCGLTWNPVVEEIVRL